MGDNKGGTKITILGAGNVGATVAYTLAVAGTCTDIVLIDINKEKAKGEAMDIRQGVSFGHNVEIKDGTYEDAADSDIVVVTLGLARKPGQTRLDLAQANVNIIKDGVIVEKRDLTLPKRLTNIIKCKNPRCITSIEQELDHVFERSEAEGEVYRCIYCGEVSPYKYRR